MSWAPTDLPLLLSFTLSQPLTSINMAVSWSENV